MECKKASNESLSESGVVRSVFDVMEEDDVSAALLERLAVCVASASSSYIMESAGVKRKEGAANKNPPTTFFVLEENLRGAVHVFLCGA